MLKIKSRYQKVILFLMISIAPMMAFQNCSKTNFKAVEENDLSSLVDPKTGFAPINVEGSSNTSENAIKVVLVLDFSHSMVNELNKVKVALNAFLDLQKTRQAFDLYMYPINDHTEYANNTYNSNIVLRAPLAQMKLRNDGTFDSSKAQFMAKLQEEINKASENTNNVNETGMCQVLRVIKEQKLYSAQDKLAIIVATDEDDSSIDSCYEKVTPVAIGRRIQFSADYVSTLATGYFTGFVKSDAGGTAPISHEYFAIAPSCGTYDIPCVAGVYQCNADLINYFKNISYYGTTKGELHSVTSVDECHVTVSNSRIGFGGTYVDDIKNLSGQSLSQSDLDKVLAQTQGFIYHGKTYNKLVDLATDIYPQYNRNVTFEFYEAYEKPEYHLFNELKGTAAQSNAAIMNVIQQKIPDASSLAIDFVIYNPSSNPAGVTCAAQDSGVLGKRYQDFVNQSGRSNLFKIESICQSNYNSPLLHAAGLTVEWSAVRDYALVGANAASMSSIREIKIVDAQENILSILNSNQYSLNFDRKILTIAASVALPQGSKIILLP